MYKTANRNFVALEDRPRVLGRLSLGGACFRRTLSRLAALILLALLNLVPGFVRAALPTLPQVFLNTTYAPPSGNTITVNAGDNLQAAINLAQPGDTIVLQAGATFAGTFTLPNKGPFTQWIYIRSSAYASLPAPGNRVSPANAASMATIAGAGSPVVALQTLAGAHHYRFVGIEIKPAAGKFSYGIIQLGNGETSLAQLPHDIVFDRCYIHGDPTIGGRRGIALNSASTAVIDSYLSDWKENGADSQAIAGWNGPGPFKIVNNYLEGAGENVMFGGADPSITNLTPSDIEIRGNHFFKPLAWIGSAWTVKNLIELKHAQRVLMEGNIFENSWQAAQGGEGISISPRNQSGTAPWSVTQDLTIRLNKIVNVGRGFNLGGRDDNFYYDPKYTSLITRRVLFENNVMNVDTLQGATGRIFQVTNGPIDTTVRHNTAFTVPAGYLGFHESTPKADQYDFRDNIASAGAGGWSGTGTSEGNQTLSTYFSNYTFTKNAIIASPNGAPNYPAGNFFPANTGAVGFVDYAGGNYRLSASSPYKNAAGDGKDLGADINAVDAATLCALNGRCGTPPRPDARPPAKALGVVPN